MEKNKKSSETIDPKLKKWLAGQIEHASAEMALASSWLGELRKKAVDDCNEASGAYEDMGPVGKARVKAGLSLDHVQDRNDFARQIRELIAKGGGGLVVRLSVDASSDALSELEKAVDKRAGLGGKLREARLKKSGQEGDMGFDPKRPSPPNP